MLLFSRVRSLLSLKIDDEKDLDLPWHCTWTWKNKYTGLPLHFLYYLSRAPTMTIKLHTWISMIWFTLSAILFLNEKEEAYGLQSGKASNYTFHSTLTGSHRCLQGEITLLPMHLMVSQLQVFLAPHFLCSSESLPHDILHLLHLSTVFRKSTDLLISNIATACDCNITPKVQTTWDQGKSLQPSSVSLCDSQEHLTA